MKALIQRTVIHRRHRGFATFVALTLMALVGLASAALMRSFSTEARRTHNEAVEAQLRQLLIVGATQATAVWDGGHIPPAPMALVLPDELAGDGMKVSLRFISAKDAASVEIEAARGSLRMRETLHLPRR